MLEQLEDRTTPSSISGVSPNYGPVAGGGPVQINGSGFTGATAVTFGGVAAYQIDVMSATEIMAEAPAHAAGVVDTVVSAPSGVSPITSADQYDYLAPAAPAVTSISPSSGPTAGGGGVYIYGSGFTGATAVSFGGASAPFDVMSATEIEAEVPSHHVAGVVDIVVTGPGGSSSTSSADQYDYLAATTTTLTSSANQSTYGQSITLTVAVSNGGSGSPTGQVDILDGSNVIGTATLSAGQATLVTSALTVGSHPLSAAYQGDEGDAVSTSNTVNLTVQQASTTTTLTSSADPSDIGQAVTLTAEVDGVSGGAPTGTITFMSGTTTLGTGTLSPGGAGSQATLTLSTLAAGSTPVVAVYGGDSNYGASSSSTLTQVVQNNGAYVWTGLVSGDWDVAGNWTVNGMVPQYAPGLQNENTQNADVIFNGVGETNVNSTTDGAVIVNSLTLDSAYTGTLSLTGSLNVTAGFDMEGGNINQPNGVGVSDITVLGAFAWSAGIMNLGNIQGNLILKNANTQGVLTGTNLSTGDNLILNAKTLGVYLTGNYTFTDNAGITISNEGSFQIWKTTNIVTAGTGIIQNNGGSFIKASVAATTNTSDLPYVGNVQSAYLAVDQGTLVFDKAGGPNNVSVYQLAGQIHIGLPGAVNPTLQVDYGLLMDGGSITSVTGGTSKITEGNVTINGGYIIIGANSTLDCSGSVTWTGGTYLADVDLTANTCSLWHAQSFTIGNNVNLSVGTLRIPAAGVPSNLTFSIITAPEGDPAGVNESINPANEILFIGGPGLVKSFKAATNGTKTAYVLTTP